MRKLASILETGIFPRVEKPSRYLGTELHAVHKNPFQVRVRILLAFPDLYDLGLGNLGLQILYYILNQQSDVWAERAYAPAVDMEEKLRQHRLPLFSLESKTPGVEFDAIGFTLQSELTYTNLLNMLDLSEIPLRAEERDVRHPLILAGGPGAFNPEPLADFIDAFVIGDGEEVILELVEVLREGRGRGKGEREKQWMRLAEIPGVYVPALYPLKEGPGGTLLPALGPRKIVRRTVRDLNQAPFPTDYLVPYTQQTHDRVSLEVLRGCTQGCRFCQAGMITRPVRERSLETLDQLMRETLDKTGYEEISLVSLNTCDHSQIRSLVRQSVARASPERISVSLPSLRLDSFSVELAHLISTIRKTGLTFAPEAATDRLRAVINKFISDQELLEVAGECYSRGWEQIKLYFMMGLPTERDEDVVAIADLANRVLDVGRRIRRKARVHLGVSTFCPQPHTAFQWAEQIGIEETERRQSLLRKGLKRGVKFGWPNPQESFLEGVIARGDRRVGKLLSIAHRLGCRFDGWREHLNWNRWQEAFRRWEEETGCRASDQLQARPLDQPLPWDHIDPLVRQEWLQEEYRRSREGEWQGDCRYTQCHHCGVMDRERDLCRTMLRRARQSAQASEEAPEAVFPPAAAEPEARQRLRFRFAKRGQARLLSHLETMNAFIRALRRAKIPVSFSQGFHPQPRLAFGTALATGIESEGEYADITLRERIDPGDFGARMNATLPQGLVVLKAWEVPLRTPSLTSEIQGAEYHLHIPEDLVRNGSCPLATRVADYLACEEILISRRTGKGTRQVNIRPMIARLSLQEPTAGESILSLRLVEHQGRTGRPVEVLTTLLGITDRELPPIRVRKVDSLGKEATPLGGIDGEK